MHSAAEVVGLLLTGGASRRMGRDKAALPYRGTTLGAHMVNLLREAGADRIVTSGKVAGERAVADREPSRGPVMGILSAVTEILEEGGRGILTVVPVDMPALSASVVRRLVDTLKTRRLLGAARYEDRELPAVFRIDGTLVAACTALLDEEDPRGASLARLLERLNAASLPVRKREADLFLNLNEPAEWAAFLDTHR